MSDRLHRTHGFSSGINKESPNFVVDKNGNMRCGGTFAVEGNATWQNVDIQILEADGDVIHDLQNSGTVVFNEQGSDIDFRIESDNQANMFVVDAGTDSIGVGAAGTNDRMVHIARQTRTATAATNYADLFLEADGAVTIPAGTTDIVATAHLTEPNITATGTVTTAATLYIAGAPSEGGTDNHALLVDAGTAAFDGGVLIGGTRGASPVHNLATSGAVVFNEQGANIDVRMESDTNSNHFVSDAGAFGGAGAFGFGLAAPDITGRAAVVFDAPAITAAADQPFYRFRIRAGNAATVPTGTATEVSTVRFDEPNITATGTATIAATCIIGGAPTEGTDNYGLLIQGDTTNVDLHSGAILAQNATDGFVFIPRLDTGAPSGTPSAISAGNVAMCYDITNDALEIYNGSGWRTIATA